MKDLEIAKKRLKEENISLCIVKDGEILYESDSQGIGYLIDVIEKSSSLKGASVADSTVGKAVALLFAYSKINSVFATTISEAALEFLKSKNIPTEFENSAPFIMNKNKDDICPFEKLALKCDDPNKALQMFRSFLKGKT